MFLKTATSVFFFLTLSAPLASQEREWSLDVTDEEAFLVFGTPNTEDIGVSFWCKLGSGKVKVYAPRLKLSAAADKSETIELTISGKTYVLKPVVDSNDDASKPALEAEIDAPNPALSDLQTAAHFGLASGGHHAHFPLFDANFAALVRACRK